MNTIKRMSVNLMIVVVTSMLFGFDSANKLSDSYEGKNIIVIVKYKAQPEKGEETVAELTKLIEKVKEEPHFVRIKLHVDTTDQTNILLYEEWSDGAYYKSDHMNTAHLQEFIANSRNFLAGPPEISIWEVKHDFKK